MSAIDLNRQIRRIVIHYQPTLHDHVKIITQTEEKDENKRKHKGNIWKGQTAKRYLFFFLGSRLLKNVCFVIYCYST